MRFIDLVRVIFENLGRHKGRVILTAVGVIIGTAAVVVLVSLGIGLQKSATENLWGMNDLTRIEVMPSYDYGEMNPDGTFPADSEPEKLTPAVLEEIQAIPGVKAVIPTDQLNGWGYLTSGKIEYHGNLVGIYPESTQHMNFSLAEGEANLSRGTIILGSDVVYYAYDPDYRPGQEESEPESLLNKQMKLNLSKFTMDGEEIKKTVQLRVIGILEQTQSSDDYSIYVSMEELNQWNEWFNGGKRINRNQSGYQNIIVKAENAGEVTEITKTITDMGFEAFSPQSMVESINGYFMILQIVFGGIGAIALVVAAVGIANTMNMAILERTREIGLMKAIGATNQDVLRIFLGESAGIGFLGGVGGALFGWLFSKAFNLVALSILANQMQDGGGFGGGISTATPIWLLLFAILFATLVGMFSGFFPAINATRQEPVKALKYE